MFRERNERHGGWGRTAWQYLSLFPDSISDAVFLYYCYFRAAAARLSPSRSTLRSSGFFLVRRIIVRRHGLRFIVRPRTEDLSFLLPLSKKAVADWFHPSRGEVVIDVGAHTGRWTLESANLGARVVAFEPNPETFAVLESNVANNKLSGVTLCRVALASSCGMAQLYVPASAPTLSSLLPGWSPSTSGESTESVLVPTSGLDIEASRVGLDRIDWVLIDVEGSELEVLRGGPNCLSRAKQVIIEVTLGPNEDSCRILLEGAGLQIRKRWFDVGAPNQYWFCERVKQPALDKPIEDERQGSEGAQRGLRSLRALDGPKTILEELP